MFYLELLDSYFPSNVFSCKGLALSFLRGFPFGLAEQMIVPKISQLSPDREEAKNIGPTKNWSQYCPTWTRVGLT